MPELADQMEVVQAIIRLNEVSGTQVSNVVACERVFHTDFAVTPAIRLVSTC